MRFQGNFPAKTDRKNRVFLPAQFRRVLASAAANAAADAANTAADAANGAAGAGTGVAEASEMLLYIRKDVFQDCLVLYPEEVWENELARLRSRLNKWIPQQQNEYRQFLLDAETVSVDANGRILLPQRLIDKIGLTPEVRFLGVDDTIEIWPKQALETPLVEEEEFGRLIQEIMK